MWSQVGSRLLASAVDSLPRLVVALIVVGVGSLIGRYVARTVLIGAVNLQIHSARLLSLAARWLVLVLAVAMGLDHLRIAADIVRLGFAILFGGIVLTMALAVGLGSRDVVSRSWKAHEKTEDEDPLRHV
jgi:diphthamide synthase (EF-2-diphthine--ammonia ligase)